MAWYKPKDLYKKGKEYTQRSAVQAKQFFRRTADTRVRITRVATAVGAGAAAFIPVVGVVAAPLVAGLGASANRINASQAARYQGETGRDARQAGRNEFQRTGIYGLGGAALGIGATAIFGAGTFGTGAPASSQASGAYSYAGGKSTFGAVAPGTSYNAAAEATMANYAAAGGPSAFGVGTSSLGAGSGALAGVNTGMLVGSQSTSIGAASGGLTGAAAGLGASTAPVLKTAASGGFIDSLGNIAGQALQAVGPTLAKLPPGTLPGTPPFNPGGQPGGTGGGDTPGGQPGDAGWAGPTGSGEMFPGIKIALAAAAAFLLLRGGRR